MEWWLILVIIFFVTVLLFLIGLPVAFAFLLVNIIGFFIFGGGYVGIRQLILSLGNSVMTFTLLPLPLFVLMGEIMFQCGLAPKMMDALDKWIGRFPGRLSISAVAGGTVFAALSGSSMASAAMLSSVLLPEMESKGYKSPMSLGPILASGGLAIMIPPSALGVLLAAVGRFSVGDFLIGIIIPGLLMSLSFGVYIIIRCIVQPELAPRYDVSDITLKEKLSHTARYILPLGIIIFLVVGTIFLGVATASESAALGASACFVLAFFYGGLKWKIVKDTLFNTLSVTVMMLMIISSSGAFSQILAFTGATHGLVDLAVNLPLPNFYILIGIIFVLLIMGCFMESITIIMITVPVCMPVIQSFGVDPVWFGVIMLLSLEMGLTTPPFGMILFVVKGLAPGRYTMLDVYKAGLPFLLCDFIVLIILLAFPATVLWLPGLMK